MKFGIISDTHDMPDHIHKAKIIFSDSHISYIVHLGDYVAPFIFRMFEGFKVYGIFGNNDGDRVRLLGVAADIGAEIKGDFYSFEEESLSFACYHGTEQALTSSLVKSGTYDFVLGGHTHEVAHETVGRTQYINPGTAHGFGKRATVAIFDTTTCVPEFIDL